jgi:hypothetical protein
MTKKKPTTVKEWEKVCENLNSALQLSIKTEEDLKEKIKHLQQNLNDMYKAVDEDFEDNDDAIEQLEEQLTMSVGVIKYLEMKLERPNPV